MVKNNRGLNKKQRFYMIIAAIAAIIAIIVMVTLFIGTSKKNGEDENKVAENFEFLVEHESSPLKNYSNIIDQKQLGDEYLENYKKGNYTIENPYIIVDPFKNSPQTALVMFKTNKEEGVTLTIKGKHNDDWTKKFEASKDHYIPVYGLYGKYTNEVILTTDSGKTANIKIKIEDSIKPEASVKVIQNDLGNQNGQVYFSTSTFGVGNVAYDNYGEVRWYTTVGYNNGMTLLQNGNLLLSAANPGPDIMSSSGVIEIDMFGRTVKEYEVEGGYHHDGYELESGNIIVLTGDVKNNTLADYVVELDRNTGKVVKDWNLRSIVSAVDDKLLDENSIAWSWTNSVTYNKNTNSIIFSIRNMNSVIALDYNTGELKWILGDKKYWSNKFNKYFLRGIGSNFTYPMGQHSVNMMSDGRISIFNNGYNAHNEVDIPCSRIKNNASYATVYTIDESNMTARIDYTFGGKEYFSYASSSYTHTANNHHIFGPAWHFGEDVNLDSSECTVFTNDKIESYIIEFDENNNMLLNIQIGESKFETLKSDIYNLAENSIKPKSVDTFKNYDFIEGQYLSTFDPDVPEELTEEEALKYEQNEALMISFSLHDNRFTLKGYVPDNMDMRITLISPSGKAYRYLLKEKDKKIKQFIDLSGIPKGRYYIYVNMDKYVYNTTLHLELE